MLLSICFAKQVVWQHICQLHLLQRHLHHHHVTVQVVTLVLVDWQIHLHTCTYWYNLLTFLHEPHWQHSHCWFWCPQYSLAQEFFLNFIHLCSDCIILAPFCYSFQCFTHSLFTFCHVAEDIFYCCYFFNYILEVNISSP